MKNKCLIILGSLALATASLQAETKRLAGGDISLMPAYEAAGSVYLDYDGNALQGSPIDFFASQGVEIMRVRLFVNPSAYDGPEKDPNACQSLDYILPLCRKIAAKGLPLMLDFHYSNTWADPAKQWTPAQWADLTDEQLYQKIYDYTRETLLTLKAEGIVPSYIATGNEISYGMLWGAWDAPASQLKKCYVNNPANWERFTTLLKQAGKACREVCPDAKIVLHTERVSDTAVQDNFYTQMKNFGVDYDIIGLSYYPYFHGPLDKLEKAVSSAESKFANKEIMIVETGYSYKWAVPGTSYDYTATFPYSEQGQQNFTQALADMLKNHTAVTGLIWWWPEYNAFGTSLSGWYNAALFNSLNGRACPAIKALGSFTTTDSGIGLTSADTDAADESPWYDLCGRRVASPTMPGIYIRHGEKIIVK